MIVYYRMTDIPSTNPSPVFLEDKFQLNLLCLKSFVEAFREVSPAIHFIMDHCPDIYDDMVEEVVPWDISIEHTEIGINKTMLRSYELARDIDDDIFLAECDHLWLPKTGEIMLMAIKKLGLVSGYDHPDFYSRFDIHPRETEIVLAGNHHFRKAARNVMSWGCHSSLIKKNLDILNKYGYLDDKVWVELRDRGHQLWTAIPSLSTHLVSNYLAPAIDWRKVLESY